MTQKKSHDGALQVEQMIAKYEKIISSPVWGKSVLLKVYLQRLREMLSNLRQVRYRQIGINNQGVEVFIVLYHSDAVGGENLSMWEGMLRRIKSSVASRPVFLLEEDALRATHHRANESYVKLIIPKDAVMLNEGSYRIHDDMVSADHIVSFHWLGRNYFFNGKRLSVSTGDNVVNNVFETCVGDSIR
ncbi:MAG: type IVB secretion system protein IcmQ [Pseudomonadota bacterium]|nr:type IVB secretion system protein IcmQ [Pseudomonadota bacterium]